MLPVTLHTAPLSCVMDDPPYTVQAFIANNSAVQLTLAPDLFQFKKNIKYFAGYHGYVVACSTTPMHLYGLPMQWRLVCIVFLCGSHANLVDATAPPKIYYHKVRIQHVDSSFSSYRQFMPLLPAVPAHC